MNVCIIDTGIIGEKRFQIMKPTRHGFNHVFPGVLFTLEDAQKICLCSGFTVDGVGDIWQCAKFE